MRTKKQTSERRRSRKLGTGAWVLILILTAALFWQLQSLQKQVAAAENERDDYAAQVAAIEQENDAMRSDLKEGVTPDKVEEIARDELGWTKSNEYVFYDQRN